MPGHQLGTLRAVTKLDLERSRTEWRRRFTTYNEDGMVALEIPALKARGSAAYGLRMPCLPLEARGVIAWGTALGFRCELP